MAEAAHGHGTGSSIQNLESFLELVGATRGALPPLQGQADIENDSLVDQVAAGVGRLQSFREALIAVTETLTTAYQDAAGELSSLAQAASNLAERRLADVRSRLDESQAAFASGVAGARDNLQGAHSEMEDEFAQAETTVAGLRDQLLALGAEQEQVFAALGAEIQGQSRDVVTRATELDEALEATSTYIVEGLEGYLAAAFETLLVHLTEEVQPLMAEMFAELNRSLLRSMDEFDVVVQSGAADLIATTEPALDETTRHTEDKRDDGQTLIDRSTTRSLRPFVDDVTKNIAVAEHGTEVMSKLNPLVPQLAAARDVVHQVQELMDVFNPFG